MPTFDRATLLRRAVESVRAQTFASFELIIVDDGSADNTPEVTAGFTDPRIRAFRHERNRGVSAARNTGIDHARGEYIAFLDDDDEFLPTKLEEQTRALDAAPPEVGIAYVWHERIGRDGEVVGVRRSTAQGDLFEDALAFRLTLGFGSTAMLRASAVAEVGGFDEALKVGEDPDYVCRLASCYQIRCISQTLARVHVGHQRLSAPSPEHETLKRKFLRRHLAKYRREFADRPRARSEVLLQLAGREVRLRNYTGALRAGFSALAASPFAASLYVCKWLWRRVFRKDLGYKGVTIPCSARVSVIIPSYNRMHLLPRAVRSVSVQSYRDWELIIVDDGSTDDTPKVVAGFADPRIRYFRHEHNRGVSAARNTGIDKARGEYVAFLDDDDEWLPDKLALQVQTLDADPELGGVYGWTDYVDTFSGEITPCARPTVAGDVSDQLANNIDLGATITWMARTEAVRSAGGFIEGVHSLEDILWQLQFARHWPVASLRRVLARAHRIHGGPNLPLTKSDEYLDRSIKFDSQFQHIVPA